MCATCIATRGIICPKDVHAVVCDKPTFTAVVEVRPRLIGAAATPEVAPVTSPVIVASSELSPEIRDTEAPQQSVDDAPSVISADELVPVIRSADEE